MTGTPLPQTCRVLVTRPLAQARATCAALEAAGMEGACFPLIDIVPVDDATAFAALATQLDRYTLVFCVSPNAVKYGVDALRALRAWPAASRLACVGEGTARALRKRGFEVLVPPGGFDSEALLALPELASAAVTGQQVLVLRGVGGRELFAQTLRERGAQVDAFACYRRLAPAGGLEQLLALAAQCQAVSLSASEAVANLVQLCDGTLPSALTGLPAIISHPRIAACASAAGFRSIIPCAPGDAGLVQALRAEFANGVVHGPASRAPLG